MRALRNALSMVAKSTRSGAAAMTCSASCWARFIAATSDRVYWATMLNALRNALIAVEDKKEKEFNAKTGVWIEKMSPLAPAGYLSVSAEAPGVNPLGREV